MSTPPRVLRALRGEAGFTLAELLAAFAVLGFVLAGATTLQQAAQQSYVNGSEKTLADQGARIALERLANDIRGATAVTAATASSITLTVSGSAVAYALSSGSLTRAGVAIVGGVNTLSFTYYDSTGTVLSSPVGTPANIRRVDITVQTQSENTLIGGKGGSFDARSQIMTSARIRNL